MLRKQLLILSFLVSTICFSQQEDYIFGQLVDSTQNESIPFASIRVKGRALGVITNIDGTFKIPLRYKTLGEIIEVSCLGYISKELLIDDLVEGQSNVIILKPGGFELSEAIVSAKMKRFSAKKIVRIAVNNIPKNYPQDKFSLVGYYRDYQVKNGNYTNLNEAIIKIADEGFSKKNSFYNEHQLLSFAKNKDFEIDSFAKQPYDYESFNKVVPNAKMKNDGGNEFIMLGMHDAIRNYKEDSFSFINDMSSDFIESHSFRILGKSNYNKESVYEIEIRFRNNHYLATGTIFINVKDFSIHKLDYALHKLKSNKAIEKKRPSDQIELTNRSERFSDGFRETNLEVLYHITTEYVRGVKEKMFLNYISFYNKVLIQRPALFKSKFLIRMADNSFTVRMNKPPANLNKIRIKDFIISYENKKIPIKEFYYLDDERTFVVCPNLGSEKLENFFERLFTEREDLLVADVTYSFDNIRDSLGNKLDERKGEYLHQYREFFTQETKTNYQEIGEYDLMIKTLPLDSNEQPVSRRTSKTDYWKNSPLPVLKN